MTVQVREGHLLRIDAVHFEDFGDGGWVGLPRLGLHFALGPLRGHAGVQGAEETVRLLDLDLASERRDELAERAELLILVAHNLDERVPIRE